MGDTSAAGTAARYRDEHGFTNVAVLDGGVSAWRKAGFPMASSVG